MAPNGYARGPPFGGVHSQLQALVFALRYGVVDIPWVGLTRRRVARAGHHYLAPDVSYLAPDVSQIPHVEAGPFAPREDRAIDP